MADKRMTPQEVVGRLESGMTIGIGGWGSRRKPMALVKAIVQSDLRDLTVVTFGGPDLGILCTAGKVKRAVYAFVAPDVAGATNKNSPVLEGHFRKARQSGAIEDEPYDEGMVLLGLQAAAWRVPFLPTRVGLGSDLLRDNPRLKTVTSPFDDGEELIAMPALELDAALVHMNRADERGNAVYLGPDPYFDDLMLAAAKVGFVSTERIVDTAELLKEAPPQALRINRAFVTGVVETPGGAAPTSCEPDYERDEDLHAKYMAAAKSDEAWDEFLAAWEAK
ncbi:MAG: putative CoA-transferase subunit alpha [Acidimicrobiales bacterium]|nr:putative CoA-transferase subunit alpha [Acidimicrobiales bacterium]